MFNTIKLEWWRTDFKQTVSEENETTLLPWNDISERPYVLLNALIQIYEDMHFVITYIIIYVSP